MSDGPLLSPDSQPYFTFSSHDSILTCILFDNDRPYARGMTLWVKTAPHCRSIFEIIKKERKLTAGILRRGNSPSHFHPRRSSHFQNNIPTYNLHYHTKERHHPVSSFTTQKQKQKQDMTQQNFRGGLQDTPHTSNGHTIVL